MTQQRQSLFDYVLLVLFRHFGLAHFQQLDYPARIEIDHEADTAAMLSEMLHSETKPTRTGWPDGNPVRSWRKC